MPLKQEPHYHTSILDAKQCRDFNCGPPMLYNSLKEAIDRLNYLYRENKKHFGVGVLEMNEMVRISNGLYKLKKISKKRHLEISNLHLSWM